MRYCFDVCSGVQVVLERMVHAPSYSAYELKSIAEKTTLSKLFADKRLRFNHQLHARYLALNTLSLAGCKALLEAKYSIAHTKKAAAFIWTFSESITTLGVDLEPKTRTLSPKALKFFSSESDEVCDTNLVALWCLKEAAFKCLDNFENKINLKNISIKQISQKRYIGQAAGMKCYCELIANPSNYFLAIAWKNRCF